MLCIHLQRGTVCCSHLPYLHRQPLLFLVAITRYAVDIHNCAHLFYYDRKQRERDGEFLREGVSCSHELASSAVSVLYPFRICVFVAHLVRDHISTAIELNP